MRGRDKTGKKLRWSKDKKDKLFLKMFRGAEERALVPKEPVVRRKPQKTLSERSKPRTEIVEETGDTLAECTFDESYDEEEEEHIALTARKFRKARETAMLQSRQVIVKNIPWDATKEDISQRFELCGDIEEVQMDRTANGVFRGQSRITFDSQQSAQKALGYNGKFFQARTMSVESAVPKPKAKQRNKGPTKELSEDEGTSSCEAEPSRKRSKVVKGGKGKGSQGRGRAAAKAAGKGKSAKRKR